MAETLRHYTVLVVDDDHAFFQAVNLELRRRRWTAVWCLDARNAVGMARQWRPDAVILDVNLPDGSGIDVVPPLRAAGYAGDIVLVTGDLEAAARARRQHVAVEQVLEKPIPLRLLGRYLDNLVADRGAGLR